MVPNDTRDLNYSQYFTDGKQEFSTAEDYTSNNTRRLNKQEVIELLLKLDYIQKKLKNIKEEDEGY